MYYKSIHNYIEITNWLIIRFPDFLRDRLRRREIFSSNSTFPPLMITSIEKNLPKLRSFYFILSSCFEGRLKGE